MRATATETKEAPEGARVRNKNTGRIGVIVAKYDSRWVRIKFEDGEEGDRMRKILRKSKRKANRMRSAAKHAEKDSRDGTIGEKTSGRATTNKRSTKTKRGNGGRARDKKGRFTAERNGGASHNRSPKEEDGGRDHRRIKKAVGKEGAGGGTNGGKGHRRPTKDIRR